MELTSKSIAIFTDKLASKAPAPGGGGAAALVSAIGAALGTMVGNLTVGKAKYAEVEPEVKALMEQSEAIRKRLTELIDEDAKAFEPLAAAYSISKDEPNRDETMESCLKTATAVPMEILELSCAAIKLMDGYAKMGSTLAISDAGCGAVFCWSAMYAAALNVRVNTRLMKDRDEAEHLNSRVDELMNTHWKIAEKTYEEVYGRLK